MNIEKTFKGEGGYVFVSHSHVDVQDVRKIRNFLEQEGMEPILFYLRCMDGGTEEQIAMLKKLIFVPSYKKSINYTIFLGENKVTKGNNKILSVLKV